MKKMNDLLEYDAAEFLANEEEMQLYLNAVMEEDPQLVLLALGEITRAKNISELSRKTGLSREGIYKALSGEGNPTFATIIKLISSLGLKLQIVKA